MVASSATLGVDAITATNGSPEFQNLIFICLLFVASSTQNISIFRK
jgi:hypothetical protein